jgi:hypothetical protein
VDQEREDARQESRKRDIQRERTRRKKEKTGEKKASGRARIPMRDENDVTIYDLSGRPRYHPHDELHDGEATKKKPPPRRPTSPTSPTTPMATSTPATRVSTRRRNTPQRLADYIHGAEYDSDNLGLNASPDYEQGKLRTRIHQSGKQIEKQIREQAESRARNAQEQAEVQKRLSKGPRDRSPLED